MDMQLLTWLLAVAYALLQLWKLGRTGQQRGYFG
jgi:hypothetical protein